jgi:hypothetical protein
MYHVFFSLSSFSHFWPVDSGTQLGLSKDGRFSGMHPSLALLFILSFLYSRITQGWPDSAASRMDILGYSIHCSFGCHRRDIRSDTDGQS